MNPSIAFLTLSSLLFIGLSASPAGARPHKPPPHKAVNPAPQSPLNASGRHCELGADADARKHEADTENTRVLDEALKALHLTRVPMKLTERNQPAFMSLGPKSDDGAVFVDAGMTEASGQTVPELTFAEDESHQLFVIDRDVNIVHSESHVLCGCGPIYGGAMIRRFYGYRIPKERNYKGHIKVKVKWQVVDLHFDGRSPDGSLCQMPPTAMPGPGNPFGPR